MSEASIKESIKCAIADFMDSYDEAQANYNDISTDFNDGMATAYREMKDILENILENSDEDYSEIAEIMERS